MADGLLGAVVVGPTVTPAVVVVAAGVVIVAAAVVVVAAAVVVVGGGGSWRIVAAGSVMALSATPGVGSCPVAGGTSQSTVIELPEPMPAALASNVNVTGGGGEVN